MYSLTFYTFKPDDNKLLLNIQFNMDVNHDDKY